MSRTIIGTSLTAAALTVALAIPSGALAYDRDDAVRDCEKRMKSEYGLSDFRHQHGEKIPGEGHKYKVKGETKIEGQKYPFECDIADRHVTAIRYDGPEPEGMSTSGKLAIGAAAAIATAAAVSAMSKEEKIEVTSDGLKACREAVAKKSEYRDVALADVFVTAKEHEDANVEWRIDTDRLADWGTCQVSADNQVLAVRTKQHQMK
jgi:hypothetical protein